MSASRRGRPRLLGTVLGLFRASRPLRFVVVGGLNTLACYLVYAGLLMLGLPFWAANFGALVFGICLNFTLQGRFVFNDRDPRRFYSFVASWLVIYAVQTAIIGLMVRAGLDPKLAGLIVLPGTAAVSYVVQKRIVFRTAGAR